MFYRILGMSVALLALAGTATAQIVGTGGSRGVSAFVTSSGPFSNSALFDVPSFEDIVSAGASGAFCQASIESELLPHMWSINGSVFASGPIVPQGVNTNVSSSANLTFMVPAGTHVQISGASVSLGMFFVRREGTLVLAGSGSYNAIVAEPTNFSILASASFSGAGSFGIRSGSYSLTVTATPVPGPASASLIGLAAVFSLSRRSRRD